MCNKSDPMNMFLDINYDNNQIITLYLVSQYFPKWPSLNYFNELNRIRIPTGRGQTS